MDRRLPALGQVGVSEYQYYEFLALDKPLTDKQRAELMSAVCEGCPGRGSPRKSKRPSTPARNPASPT